MSSDQALRRTDYVKVQQILAAELPSINLWYLDAVLVHTRRSAEHPYFQLRQLRLPAHRNGETITYHPLRSLNAPGKASPRAGPACLQRAAVPKSLRAHRSRTAWPPAANLAPSSRTHSLRSLA